MQGALGQDDQRAGHHQIVALNEPHEGEYGNDQDVVAAERDAIELAPKHLAGAFRSDHRADFGHITSQGWSNPRGRCGSLSVDEFARQLLRFP